jgi:hypothetical protein
MDEEMATLNVNVTWELIALPKDKKTIRCKWVYKVKHNVDGSVSSTKQDWWPKVMPKLMA